MRLSYAFSAPPDVVFRTVTDPSRVDRWMPDDVAVSAAGEVWQVSFAGQRQEYRVQVVGLTVSWEPLETGWPGGATVRANPAGGSVLEVLVKGVSPAADTLVDTILSRLESQVATTG
jgi:uncharacterized protein YndB with AHSA1/START domain